LDQKGFTKAGLLDDAMLDSDTFDDGASGLTAMEDEAAPVVLAINDGGRGAGLRGQNDVFAVEIEVLVAGAGVGARGDED
jgi:hypothetical protein